MISSEIIIRLTCGVVTIWVPQRLDFGMNGRDVIVLEKLEDRLQRLNTSVRLTTLTTLGRV